MSTGTIKAQSAVDTDPIDVLVPRPQPKWVRLLLAVAVVGAVGLLGYMWQFGSIRPSPDCCGSSSSWVPLGQSGHDDAVTVVVSFYNSSPRSIDVERANVKLDGATVIDVAPVESDRSAQFPPDGTGQFPATVARHTDLQIAVTFSPDRCSRPSDSGGWGNVQLDLAVSGDPWYPTFGRTFDVAVLEPGPNEVTVLPPARLDGVAFDTTDPLSVACVFLGR